MLTQADIDWIVLDSVDSTNAHLCAAYARGERTGVVALLAHAQTQGRGRAGRAWVSEPGASLCLSIGLPIAGSQLPFLPICVGVGVAECLQAYGVRVQLKWPNDILINEQKLGGILCESSVAYTVIGLGLNLKPISVPVSSSGLQPTSLQAHWHSGQPFVSNVDWARRLVPSIVSAVELGLKSGLAPLAAMFSKRDAFLGHKVLLQDGHGPVLQGTAMGLSESGAYLIDTVDGLMPVHAGDLSLRLLHD